MKRIIVVAFCILVVAASGCRRDVAQVPEETAHSVETTLPAPSDTGTSAAEETGAGVHSPSAGDTEYATIVSAASAYLRVPGTLVVHQVSAEGDSAVMDAEAPPADTGWRTHLALTRNGEEWAVTFSADAFDGTPTFEPEWFPGMSERLLGSIEWTRARTSLEEAARTHALEEAATLGGFTYSQLDAGALKLARTAAHEWWASCVVSHQSASIDPLTVYMRWQPDGDGWETFDCGTGVEPETDPRFPSDVADGL